jgi:hypothetical protein
LRDQEENILTIRKVLIISLSLIFLFSVGKLLKEQAYYSLIVILVLPMLLTVKKMPIYGHLITAALGAMVCFGWLGFWGCSDYFLSLNDSLYCLKYEHRLLYDRRHLNDHSNLHKTVIGYAVLVAIVIASLINAMLLKLFKKSAG